ncbi:hypothetical protein CEE44_00760 [Candidatus Woesearchaeota archaeon B3_Woes]|nr:MAG: hypothetical protein CEE44_00760 [Candidatus Woesearchaeota archaeon B3_Woes]
MPEVIGVLHLDRNLDRLIETIDLDFGVPKSLMLELPTDWRDYRDGLITDGYFHRLASEYEKRGTRIIAGDNNRYIIEPHLSEWFLDFEERVRNGEWNPDTLKDWSKGVIGFIGEMSRYNSLLNWNQLFPSKHRIRNHGFLEVYDECKPELTVVGCVHGKHLKNQRPDVNYTFFMTDSLIERMAFPVHYYLLGSAKADSYKVLPSSSS